jgi:hypothetical protein
MFFFLFPEFLGFTSVYPGDAKFITNAASSSGQSVYLLISRSVVGAANASTLQTVDARYRPDDCESWEVYL